MTPRRVNLLLGVVAMLVFPPLLARYASGLFLFNELAFYILARALCIAIAAIALNLLMGYAGQISLGHAAIGAIAACVA
ncbi:MAG: hypothetical protein ACRD1T_08175, partial [Acidimicrobiia bacterium]